MKPVGILWIVKEIIKFEKPAVLKVKVRLAPLFRRLVPPTSSRCAQFVRFFPLGDDFQMD